MMARSVTEWAFFRASLRRGIRPRRRKICDGPLACIDGRCVQPSPLPEVGEGDSCWGESCADDGCWETFIALCADEFYCDFSTGSCEPRAALGDACQAIGLEVCADGLVCHEGRCVPGGRWRTL